MAEMLIRMGDVSSIDYENGMVSVTYPDMDDCTTDEFPVLSCNDEYKMPAIDDEVIVLHFPGDQSAGVVLGKVWSDDNPPQINGAGAFRKELAQEQGAAFIGYKDGTVTIHADKIVLDADVEIKGKLTVSDETAIKSKLTTTGDTIANGISVGHHVHNVGSGTTSEPV